MDITSLQDKFPRMSQAEKTARCVRTIAAALMPMLADALTPKPATFADFARLPSSSDEQV